MIASSKSNRARSGNQGHQTQEGCRVGGKNRLAGQTTPNPDNGQSPSQAILSPSNGTTRNGKTGVSSTLLTVSQAGNLLGVSPSTVRNLIERGEIGCYVLPSGHRRIPKGEINIYNGYDEGQQIEGEDSGVVCYARVSSAGQERKGALERQTERLREAVKEREGIDNVQVFADTASPKTSV